MFPSIYLSLDLDVFTDVSMRLQFDDIMSHVVNHHDVKVCMSHEKLLGHVNTAQVRELWNVDYHTDLYARGLPDNITSELTPLDCSNWCSYVEWRHESRFVWVQPHLNAVFQRDGRCDPYLHIPLTDRKAFEWCVVVRDIQRVEIPWDRVERIGVAVSPDYTDPKVLKALVWQSKADIRRWFGKKRVYDRAYEWLMFKGRLRGASGPEWLA